MSTGQISAAERMSPPMHHRSIISLVLSALLTGSLTLPALTQTRIRILFTHDLHSSLLPSRIVTPDGAVAESGGFARLATAIHRASSADPAGVILVDAGDFTMGTLYHTLFLTTSPELQLMGDMGYDVGTFGNHDFDFHLDGLARYLHNARATGKRLPLMVLANLDLQERNGAVDSLAAAFKEYGVQPFTVLERHGVRIGVFGVMGKDADDDSPFIGPATFDDHILSAMHTVERLRDSARADVILCLSHAGTVESDPESEDYQLARRVPAIDVVISGHTHRVLREPLIVGSTVIASAGSFGSHLGIIDLQCSPGRRPLLEHYELVPISSSLPGDTAIARAIDQYTSLVDRQFLAPLGLRSTQIIAESAFDFPTLDEAYQHPGENGLGDMIADAYRYAVARAEGPGAHPPDVVLVPIGMIRGSFHHGPITVADIFQVLSLGLGPDMEPGYPLVTTFLTGADLLQALEIETTVTSLKEDAHLQVAGIQFRYNPYRVPFNRITDAEIVDTNGHAHPIEMNRLYRVCVCLYSGIMMANVQSLSHGLFAVQPRRSDGSPQSGWKESTVDANPSVPGTQELKSWIALMQYLRTFPPREPGGVPEIPDRYRTPAHRITARASLNPADLVRNPNRFTVVFAGGTFLIILGLAAVILRIRARLHVTGRR